MTDGVLIVVCGRRHPIHRFEALMVVLVCSSSFGCIELDNESENVNFEMANFNSQIGYYSYSRKYS